MKTTRRKFIADISIDAAGITAIPFLSPLSSSAKSREDLFFKISLAQWSLKTTFFGKDMTTGMAYFKNPPDPSCNLQLATCNL